MSSAVASASAAAGGGGQTLADRYRMTRKVGDGTFGEVSLAKKLDTGDVVAIKRYDLRVHGGSSR